MQPVIGVDGEESGSILPNPPARSALASSSASNMPVRTSALSALADAENAKVKVKEELGATRKQRDETQEREELLDTMIPPLETMRHAFKTEVLNAKRALIKADLASLG